MKQVVLILIIILSSWSGPVYAAPADLVDDQNISSVEERRILVEIEEEYVKLDEKTAKIDAREMQLKTLEAEVDKKLAAMKSLRDELVKLLDRKDDAENERVGELSRIYEKMSPQKSAILIKELDHQLAVDLLLGIKKKTAGKILDSLDAETATELSKAFTTIE